MFRLYNILPSIPSYPQRVLSFLPFFGLYTLYGSVGRTAYDAVASSRSRSYSVRPRKRSHGTGKQMNQNS